MTPGLNSTKEFDPGVFIFTEGEKGMLNKEIKRLLGVNLPVELIKRLKVEAARHDSTPQKILIALLDRELPKLQITETKRRAA